eukprot:GHVN01029912.1.p1 GENE.GHVN01029912.1~~GHVN01029912.1.p1  ORF type:complete len:949 (-),score=311.60 GHVN01029912.1:454-3300(-)
MTGGTGAGISFRFASETQYRELDLIHPQPKISLPSVAGVLRSRLKHANSIFEPIDLVIVRKDSNVVVDTEDSDEGGGVRGLEDGGVSEVPSVLSDSEVISGGSQLVLKRMLGDMAVEVLREAQVYAEAKAVQRQRRKRLRQESAQLPQSPQSGQPPHSVQSAQPGQPPHSGQSAQPGQAPHANQAPAANHASLNNSVPVSNSQFMGFNNPSTPTDTVNYFQQPAYQAPQSGHLPQPQSSAVSYDAIHLDPFHPQLPQSVPPHSSPSHSVSPHSAASQGFGHLSQQPLHYNPQASNHQLNHEPVGQSTSLIQYHSSQPINQPHSGQHPTVMPPHSAQPSHTPNSTHQSHSQYNHSPSLPHSTHPAHSVNEEYGGGLDLDTDALFTQSHSLNRSTTSLINKRRKGGDAMGFSKSNNAGGANGTGDDGGTGTGEAPTNTEDALFKAVMTQHSDYGDSNWHGVGGGGGGERWGRGGKGRGNLRWSADEGDGGGGGGGRGRGGGGWRGGGGGVGGYGGQQFQPDEKIEVSESYICHMCGHQGHHIRNCPRGSDSKRQKKIIAATGIPRSFLQTISPDQVPSIEGLVYVLPDGTLCVYKNTESLASSSFFSVSAEQKIAERLGGVYKTDTTGSSTSGTGTSGATTDTSAGIEKPGTGSGTIVADAGSTGDGLGESLRCPLCGLIFKDPVVVFCCGESFCRHCITNNLRAQQSKVSQDSDSQSGTSTASGVPVGGYRSTQGRGNCPSCNQSLNIETDIEVNRALRESLGVAFRPQQRGVGGGANSTSAGTNGTGILSGTSFSAGKLVATRSGTDSQGSGPSTKLRVPASLPKLNRKEFEEIKQTQKLVITRLTEARSKKPSSSRTRHQIRTLSSSSSSSSSASSDSSSSSDEESSELKKTDTGRHPTPGGLTNVSPDKQTVTLTQSLPNTPLISQPLSSQSPQSITPQSIAANRV